MRRCLDAHDGKAGDAVEVLAQTQIVGRLLGVMALMAVPVTYVAVRQQAKALRMMDHRRAGDAGGEPLVVLRGDKVSASPVLLDRLRAAEIDWPGAKVHFGLMLSSSVLIDFAPLRDRMVEEERDALGAEMEGGGIHAAATRRHVPWIVAKAVSDWGAGKTDEAQVPAARDAADFVVHMVSGGALALVGFQATAQTASAATKVVTCTTANTKVTVTKPSRPINHLLLKATNTGTKPCYAYSAPFLRAGADAQAPLAWADETTPQSVLVLKPGKSAYAGITTSSPDGEGGSKAKTLGVIFANKKGNATNTEKTLKLVKGGVFFNSAANVTYWQDNAADALVW